MKSKVKLIRQKKPKKQLNNSNEQNLQLTPNMSYCLLKFFLTLVCALVDQKVDTEKSLIRKKNQQNRYLMFKMSQQSIDNLAEIVN